MDQNETTPSPEEVPSTTVIAVLSAIQESIKSGNSSVKDLVIQASVSAEINRRKDVLLQALNEYKTKDSALKKESYPDIKTYNADGTVASATFSKAKLDELSKSKQELAKLSKLIGNAIDKGDYSELYQKFKV